MKLISVRASPPQNMLESVTLKFLELLYYRAMTIILALYYQAANKNTRTQEHMGLKVWVRYNIES